jgi:NAD(P)H-dependent FMN reductase
VLRLQIVIASTRPGRVGLSVGHWLAARACAHDGLEPDVVDLAELALPLMDEPHHPRLGKYVNAHTRAWSARVAAADAFVFVTPEYNHGYPAALKNAIDYLHAEWRYKPVGFVSYGGVAAGTRAVQQLEQVVTAVRMVPVLEAVALPFVSRLLDDDGILLPNATAESAADAMLAELARAEEALRPLREGKPDGVGAS